MRYFLYGRFLPATAIAATLMFSVNHANAGVPDDSALIEGAKLCTNYLPRHERAYGIPVHLLAAIASTESGRYNKEIGLSLPWPWTINVEGKGYFYNSKAEAVAAVRELQKRGFQSIDVGCMQVNLHHHPNAFTNLEQAFDPAYNIAYAAQFLKHNFQDEGSWRKATADYHSRTPIFGNQYANLVFSSWGRIINKVSEARSGKLALKTDVAKISNTNMSLEFTNNSRTPARHTYHALHMHSISVSRDTTREKGVLVIRPEHTGEAIKEVAKADEQFVSHHVKSPASYKPAQENNETENSNARVVKVQNGPAKGQFTPSVHTIKTEQASERITKQNSIFVFDN